MSTITINQIREKLSEGDIHTARKMATKFIELSPHSADVEFCKYLKGLTYFAEGRYEAAGFWFHETTWPAAAGVLQNVRKKFSLTTKE